MFLFLGEVVFFIFIFEEKVVVILGLLGKKYEKKFK